MFNGATPFSFKVTCLRTVIKLLGKLGLHGKKPVVKKRKFHKPSVF